MLAFSHQTFVTYNRKCSDTSILERFNTANFSCPILFVHALTLLQKELVSAHQWSCVTRLYQTVRSICIYNYCNDVHEYSSTQLNSVDGWPKKNYSFTNISPFLTNQMHVDSLSFITKWMDRKKRHFTTLCKAIGKDYVLHGLNQFKS